MLERNQFYIDGAWIDPAAGRVFEVIDPSTEEVCAGIGRKPSEPGIRRAQRQRKEAAAIDAGEAYRDAHAHGQADKVSAVRAEMIEHPDNIFGEGAEAQSLVIIVAVSVATRILGNRVSRRDQAGARRTSQASPNRRLPRRHRGCS